MFPTEGEDQEVAFGNGLELMDTVMLSYNILEASGLNMVRTAGYADAISRCQQGDWARFISSCRGAAIHVKDTAVGDASH